MWAVLAVERYLWGTPMDFWLSTIIHDSCATGDGVGLELRG